MLQDEQPTPFMQVALTPQATREARATSNQPEPAPLPVQTPTAAAAASAAESRVSPLMAIGQRATITLRESPAAGSRIVRSLPGSDVLWAQALSPDGRWLKVAYDDVGNTAWVARSDVSLFGDPTSLRAPDEKRTAVTPAVLAGSPSPVAAFSEGRVTANTLNIRGGPGEDQPILGQLRAGDTVRIIARTPDGAWAKIEREGADAWVAARYLTDAARPAPARSAAPARTTTGLTGKIAFQTRTGGDIYLINADGSNLQRVTDGMDPALSPDGTRLAYARWGAPHAIFVRDLRTGEERQVAAVNRPRGPAWSSDGSKLVFTYSTRNYMCRVSPFGCLEEDELRDRFGGDCLVTPFGKICIADLPLQQVDDFGLVSINPDGSGWQDIPAQKKVFTPGWRPGDSEILYKGDLGLQMTTPNGETRPLVNDLQINSPAWSPEGQRIAVQQYLHDHADLFILDAGGNVQQRLTAPPTALDKGSNNVSPAWSPDGATLLFLSDRDGAWKLYQIARRRLGSAFVRAQRAGRADFRL